MKPNYRVLGWLTIAVSVTSVSTTFAQQIKPAPDPLTAVARFLALRSKAASTPPPSPTASDPYVRPAILMPNSTQVDKLLSVTPTYAIARMSSPQPEGVTVSVYLYVGYTNKTIGWEVAATRGPEQLLGMLSPDIGMREVDWRKNQRLANARIAVSRDEDVIAWFETRRARLDAFRGRWTPTDTTGITYIPGPDNGTLRPQKLAFELASLTDFQALAFDLKQGTMTAALMNIQNDGVWFVHSPAKEPVSPGYGTMYQWVEPLGSGWYFVRAANACGGNASTRWYCRNMR